MKTNIANELFEKIIESGIQNVEFELSEEGERRGSFVFTGGQIVKIEVTSKEAQERYFNKINGLTEFKAPEIRDLSELMKLTPEEITAIFFVPDDGKLET